MCIQNMTCEKQIKREIILTLKIISASYHFVIAQTEDTRVLALGLSLSLQIIISNYYFSQLNEVL